MEQAAGRAPEVQAPEVQTSEHGLKAGAISFWEGLVIALASTAPAYSLAAVVGSIVVAVGFYAPASLLVAFIPMFFIAAAFYWLNKADQDCGTTFSWVTRAFGPNTGWIAGWAVCMTGILVIGSLADVAVLFFFELIDVEPHTRRDRDRRGAPDRGDDDRLRDRHRGLGQAPDGADGAPDPPAAPLRRRDPVQGLRRRRAGQLLRAEPLLVQPPQHRGRQPEPVHRGVAAGSFRRCCSASSSTGAGRAPST